MLKFYFLLLCITLSSAQFREIFDVAHEAANGLNDLSSEVVKEEEGIFIRTAYKDGCLDAGCCTGFSSQVRFNLDCPSWGWLKWSFNGPMLVVHRPFFHACMECKYGEPDCLIAASSCKGKHSQYWYLNYSNKRRNNRGEGLFTIVNNMYPDRCITIDETSLNLHLRPCGNPVETQLFYISKNWISEVKRLERESPPARADPTTTQPADETEAF